MRINLDNMARDLAAWDAEEKEAARSKVTIKTRCFSLDDAGITDGAWTAQSAIAFARAMIQPGSEGPGFAPSRALAALQKLATVPDAALALAALQFEKGAGRRERSAHGDAVERLTIAEGYRENRRRRRSVNNLTAPCGTSHVYRGRGA